MKLIVARATLIALIGSTSAISGATGRSPAAEQCVQFLKSLGAGTIHLIRKLYAGETSAIISKFCRSISDESLLAMITGHFRLVRALNSCGARALTRRYPNYVNKYATNYIAQSFNKCDRREILKFHHQYLAKYVTESFYDEILDRGRNLWSETIAENRYAISISFNPHYHSEGDLLLIFDKSDLPLYEISFSIVPGRIVGCASAQALLIGGVQGRIGQAEAIKVSTKACHDIAPSHLLLAAALSIAEVLAIDVVAGVSNEEQLSKVRQDVGCYFDYNAFWETLSVKKNGANIYLGSIPLPEKPIEQIRSKHRGRVRLKRRLRKEIAEQVGATFARNFTRGSKKIVVL